ncbi:MAG: lipopolysaccharide biosynthesis protein [Bacteroidota bacterium]
MAVYYALRPVLTRLYEPADFGVLALFTAIVAVFSVGAAGRYDDALMQPETDREAGGLLALCLTVLAGVTVLTVPLVIWRDQLAAWLGEPDAAPYLALVPLGLIGAGAMRILKTWHTRQRRFGLIASGEITHNAARGTVQVGAALAAATPAGLIGGAVAGQVAAAALWGVRIGRGVFSGVTPGLMRTLAGRYRQFPQFGLPSGLLNTASVQLPALLLFYYFGAQVAGWYGQAAALLTIPIAIVGGSVGQAFFVEAADAVRSGTLPALARRVANQLAYAGAYPMLAVVLAGPDLVAFVLGEPWRPAGVYAQWLAPWLFFVLVSSPLSRLFDVLERQRAALAFNLILFGTRAATLVAGGLLASDLLAIQLFGGSGALLWLLHTVWMLGFATVPVRDGLRMFARWGLFAGVLTMPLWVVSGGWAVVIACAGAALYYGILAWPRGRAEVL